MEEKKISKVEFDEAVKQAIHEQVNDPNIEGYGQAAHSDDGYAVRNQSKRDSVR